ncbi:MAG TPA: CDP-alcohol phosphatidyltransferase family protein, partial [Tepidisphaeraceae bacterium]|nr:CDP-alcohol phosphatidyltransferase family protein [Tepidisphaeraceae bacterium]
PNLLTGLRLVLAFVFFAMLSWYQYEGRGDPTFLNVAFLIYLVALLTDYFDGYLARKWKVEGTFGRILDPFVDKVLVLGSFIFFAGKNFVIPDTEFATAGQPMVVKTITGVAPAMVVVLLARELLVTSLRGISEASGQNFGAVMAGKVKMVLQSVTILVILVYVNYLPWLRDHWELPARIIRDVFIWLTLVVTVGSSLSYIRRGIALYHGKRDDKTALTK